jgi:hypothetical protein
MTIANTRLRLPEDDADAPKHGGVLSVYKILFMYIYVYIYIYVGLDNKLYKLHGTCINIYLFLLWSSGGDFANFLIKFHRCCYDSILPCCSLVHSFIPLACAKFDDSLPFSGASSIPLYHVLFLATLLHQLFFHPSPHLAIYFLAYLSIMLFPNSYIILFLGILFSSILCTCPKQHNLFNLIVSIIVRFLTLA